ncbi:MAG TPA: TonB-dependent receptor [Gemmatimonadales bacterium]|nr:TonB-dependent receptor [Gemmatimonadales bacterium]
MRAGHVLALVAPSSDTVSSLANLTRVRAALEYAAEPVERLALSAGVLYERQTGGDTEASGTGTSIGLEYRVADAVGMRGSYGNRFRFPSVRQLFDPAGGNPDLEPERSERVELGVDVQVSRAVALSLVGFVDDARNFIERPARDSAFANRERYRFAGVEALVAWAPAPRSLVRAGYSWLEAEDRSEGREGARLDYRPRHKLTLEGRHAFGFGLEAQASLRWQADQVYSSRRGELRQRPLPDFVVGTVRAEQWFARRFGVFAGVDNVFDVAYEEAYGFPQAGRVLYGGFDVRR